MSTVDVTGQAGGPSPEEQARVDADQAVLIKRIRAERSDGDAERAQRLELRQQAAREAAAERRALFARLDGVEARLHMLEEKG